MHWLSQLHTHFSCQWPFKVLICTFLHDSFNKMNNLFWITRHAHFLAIDACIHSIAFPAYPFLFRIFAWRAEILRPPVGNISQNIVFHHEERGGGGILCLKYRKKLCHWSVNSAKTMLCNCAFVEKSELPFLKSSYYIRGVLPNKENCINIIKFVYVMRKLILPNF
jgi:hypothetical protein